MAKSELLKLAAEELGLPARFVRWRYLLPDVVAEVGDLPSRLDVHRAVQVHACQQWVLADATHH
jgi:transglutaminase-like putative cysteine protease